MRCPVCGCQEFFVKDPDDEFETREFSIAGGDVRFSAVAADDPVPDIQEVTEAFCNKCSWHGQFRELKKT